MIRLLESRLDNILVGDSILYFAYDAAVDSLLNNFDRSINDFLVDHENDEEVSSETMKEFADLMRGRIGVQDVIDELKYNRDLKIPNAEEQIDSLSEEDTEELERRIEEVISVSEEAMATSEYYWEVLMCQLGIPY